MSKTDLDRLVVRQTYFVPIGSSQLSKEIQHELNIPNPVIGGLYSWVLLEKHGLSFHFQYSLKWSFVFDETWGMNLTTKEGKKLAQQKIEEFESTGKQGFFAKLQDLRSDIPCHLYVAVINEEENGCLCKVECLPMLYEKLRYIRGFKTNETEMQNAYIESRRFLEIVFESGLSATLVKEQKKLPLLPITEFLLSDQTSRQILNRIETMLDQATGEVLICGWIGTLLLPKLRAIKEKGINIRIITHKSAELKGKPGRQDVARAHMELISLLGKDHISIHPECHFRVLVVNNKALLGSMDFNAISLTGTHREFAIYTEIPEIVRSIRNYLNQIFTPLEGSAQIENT
jgi:hypothetical protein